HRDLHSFPTRRSSDLPAGGCEEDDARGGRSQHHRSDALLPGEFKFRFIAQAGHLFRASLPCGTRGGPSPSSMPSRLRSMPMRWPEPGGTPMKLRVSPAWIMLVSWACVKGPRPVVSV